MSFDVHSENINFKMIDVGGKRPTSRRAIATGSIVMNQEAFDKIKEKKLNKGDALSLAEISGVLGAKKTPDILPMCHPLGLDQVLVSCALDDEKNSIVVYAQAATFSKTGVEMEALMAVNSALLCIWDLTKSTDPKMKIGDVRLLAKTGGKSGVWRHEEYIPEWLNEQLPSSKNLLGKESAVLVMSDRASKGVYQDESGKLLTNLLSQSGSNVKACEVIPDDVETIKANLKSIVEEQNPHILFACGGTGPGPRDVTPVALEGVCSHMLNGLGEYLRRESGYFTDTAWLSRMTAGMLNSTLVIAFPGSPKAVKECFEMIEPFIGVAIDRIRKQGYES